MYRAYNIARVVPSRAWFSDFSMAVISSSLPRPVAHIIVIVTNPTTSVAVYVRINKLSACSTQYIIFTVRTRAVTNCPRVIRRVRHHHRFSSSPETNEMEKQSKKKKKPAQLKKKKTKTKNYD